MVMALGSLLAVAVLPPARAVAAARPGERVFTYDDQYIQLEADVTPGDSKTRFGLDIAMTPKGGWKILADNSTGTRPLRLTFSPGKCLRVTGKSRMPAPDVAGTDESGAYSEYFTQKATIRQDFTTLACGQKKRAEGAASLHYLLCQNNKCVGPFSREIRFRAPEQK